MLHLPNAITQSTKNIAMELLCSCCTALGFGRGGAVDEVVSFFDGIFAASCASEISSWRSGIDVMFTSISDGLMVKFFVVAEGDTSTLVTYPMKHKITAMTLK